MIHPKRNRRLLSRKASLIPDNGHYHVGRLKFCALAKSILISSRLLAIVESRGAPRARRTSVTLMNIMSFNVLYILHYH